MLQVVIELPYVLVQTLVYGVIVYAMINFEWTAAKFFWFIFYTYFTFLYFTLYGMMTVSFTPNHQVAAIVSSAFYGVWNLFAGFMIPRPVNTESHCAFDTGTVGFVASDVAHADCFRLFDSSKFPSGGDGIIGQRPWLGPCMA